jgi:hypothetical protein
MLASLEQRPRIEGEAQAQLIFPTLSPLRWSLASPTPCSGRSVIATNLLIRIGNFKARGNTVPLHILDKYFP